MTKALKVKGDVHFKARAIQREGFNDSNDRNAWVHVTGRLNLRWGDFLDSPVSKTVHSQCRESRSDAWSGNWMLTCDG